MTDHDKIIQAAKDRLESAQLNVATLAQCVREVRRLQPAHGEAGVVVDLGDWRELQEALAEWRKATHAFLVAVTDASKGDAEAGVTG